MDELRSGLTAEERELLLGDLDIEHAAALPPEHLERLAAIWDRIPTTGRPAVLRARSVDHPSGVFARFIAYDFLGPRGAAASGWFVTGYVAHSSSGEVVLERLAIEPEHEDQPGVTTEVLRGIAPAEILVRTRHYLAVAPDVLDLERELEVAPSSGALGSAPSSAAGGPTSSPRRRGRPPLDDDVLEAFAHELIADYAANRRGVLRRAAERHGISWEGARRRAREATKRGYLAPRERGQNAFVPGWKLLPRKWDGES